MTKKSDLTEYKNMEEKALIAKIKALKADVATMVLDRNMNKLKDVKAIGKHKKQIAQVSTILRQKQLLKEYQNA